MVWDKNNPKVTTKLRIAPAIITENWDALETGNVPFKFLQILEQATEFAGTHPATGD